MTAGTAHDIEAIVALAERDASVASGPEEAIHALVRQVFDRLGDRQAHLRPEALAAGQQQYFVGGAFLVTPDRRFMMLVGNIGFPPEQKRLLVPIDGGNPGQVIASGQPLILEDTTVRADFRQYLKTSRMGSAIYAPLNRDGRTIGLLIMAAQARWTMRPADLDVLVALAPVALTHWTRLGGDAWLDREYASL